MWDGLVIGGGLAGLVAGIRAQERGKKVLIVSEGTGSLMFASGGLDFGQVERLRQAEQHPYALLQGAVEDAFIWFRQFLPAYRGTWGKTRNMLTPLGTLRETTLLPQGLDAAPLFQAERIILVEPEGLKDFFPEVVKANLQKQFASCIIEEKTLQVEEFTAWKAGGKPVAGNVYAQFWYTDRGQSILRNLSAALRRRGALDSAVLVFPGLHAALCPQVEELLRQVPLPVVEMTSLPPAAGGEALRERLQRRFNALGGEMLVGARVERLETDAGQARLAIVQSKGKALSLAARAFVLATGGFFGRGIAATPTEVRETVCGLPLFVPTEWSRRSFLEEQPYARTGIEVDSGLRPCEPGTGKVLLDNVFVAGRMLAHWDPWSEHCGGGVSLSSGYRAGELI